MPPLMTPCIAGRRATDNAKAPDTFMTTKFQIERPWLQGFTGFIDHGLLEDLRRSRKQRQTAKRVFGRLRKDFMRPPA